MSQSDGEALAPARRAQARPWHRPARRLLGRVLGGLRRGRIVVHLPDGGTLSHRGALAGPEAVVTLHRWRALARLAVGGDLGFADAFIDGDWSSPDLPAVIELAACNSAGPEVAGPDVEPGGLARAMRGMAAQRGLAWLRHKLRANTRRGSRRNIVFHYDLGNAFYAAWLDGGMSYSSGLYGDGAATLEQAQRAKQDRVLALLELQAGQDVLEIGCGWGGLAERIAAAGARLDGVTLSPAQLDYAQARLAEAGLADRARLRLQDYRDVAGRFERVVCIEMLEAVGEAYWPVFFDRLRARLVPGGVAVLQVITIDPARFAAYRRQPDFIQARVFPGGMLPTGAALRAQAVQAGLVLDHAETFGASYARTLADWRRRFHAAWRGMVAGGAVPAGDAERFRRLWDYYLAYCEGGFRARAIDVGLYRLRLPH